MDLTEKRLSRKEIFQGHIVNVHIDTVELPNGAEATREVVDHPGGVAVLALDEDETVTLVRQFRYPVGQVILELPAGKIDPGEDTLLAAKRELSEETGVEAGDWTYLGYALASPGFCDEALHMYLARDLRRVECHPDVDEFLEVTALPFQELVRMVMAGSIIDAKTVAMTLKVKTLLGM